MPAIVNRISTASLLLALVIALPGCDRPEGLGTVDAELARPALLAQGGPDPLSAAGQVVVQIVPKGAKRPISGRRR
jgi:hypothetical protein